MVNDGQYRGVSTERSLASLLRRGTLTIPPNQREFTWNGANTERLLGDIKKFLDDKEPDFFLGSMVTIKDDTESAVPNYDLQDGQQRATVFSMIMAEFVRRLSDTDRKKIARDIVRVHDDGLRIATHDQNKTNYENAINGTCIDSGPLLSKCYQIIKKAIGKLGNGDLNLLFDYMVDKVYVVEIAFSGSATKEAYGPWVFDSENDTGVSMSPVDSLLNYFHREASVREAGMREAGRLTADNKQRKLEESINRVKDKVYDVSKVNQNELGEYIRTVLICRCGDEIGKEKLVQDGKKMIQQEVEERSREMPCSQLDIITEIVEDLADPRNIKAFKASYEIDAGNEHVREFVKMAGKADANRNMFDYLRELRHYHGVSLSVKYAVMSKFLHGDREQRQGMAKGCHDIMQTLNAMVMRVPVSGKGITPSKLRNQVAQWSHRIMEPEDIDSDRARSITDEMWMHPHYGGSGTLDDIVFKGEAEKLTKLTSQSAKDIILSFGQHMSECKYKADGYTREHILPKDDVYADQWDFDPHTRDMYKQTLGNQTMLPSKDNKGTKEFNGGFDGKRDTYRESSFGDNTKIANLPRWDKAAVSKRQKNMARLACEIWKPSHPKSK